MERSLFYVLWALSNVAQVYLIWVIYKQRLRAEYPIFFVFVVVAAFECWALMGLWVFGTYKAYFWTYWILTVPHVALDFAVLHELFDHIFRPYESLRNLGVALFRWVALVVFVISLIITATATPLSKYGFVNVLMAVDRSVSLMQVGLVLFIALFAPYVGLSHRHRVFGISLGFGMYAAMELIAVVGYSVLGAQRMALLNIAKNLIWLGSIATWTIYMSIPEPERRRARQFERPEEWNSTLNGIAYGKPESAFLPNVVDTVEKVLARRASALVLDGSAQRTTLKN